MKTVSNRDIFRLFWVHILRYKWRALVVVLAIVVATAADLVVPWFLKAFIDTLATSAPSGLALRTLIGILLSLLGLHGIGWVAWRVCGFVNSDFQPRVMADLQRTGFDHLLGHSYAFFADNFAGSLTRRVVRVSRAFERIADEMSFRLIPIVLILIGTSIGLSLRSPALMGVFLVWTGVFLYTNYLASLWKLAIDVVRAAADSRITAALSDSITNSITVKIFNGVREETRRLADVLRSWRLLSTRAWNRGEVIFAIQGALMILLEFGMLVYGSILWRRGIFGVGDLVLIQSYLLVAFNKLWDFGRSFRNIFEALADAREMVEILALPHEVRDRRRPKTFAVRRGRIEFKEVSFAFHRTRVVLDRFSLAIRPGERVALVGPSGAGKSTVTRLLFRFHDLSAGRILIDGQDIAAVAQDDLRAGIALVPQEPILFHRTLMENIRYGRRDATDDEVIAAATEARCHEFISELPAGYGTYVGERGVKLSGGERQRVAIARAILKDAPILVLDEATSSLDSASERLIHDALERLMRDKTSLVIAHRLSTIMAMDRIVVLERGKVTASGTHAELLAAGGTYKRLWNIQAGGFLGDMEE